jgi:2-oxoglutarate-Fe(II)-dependent oxygenase superfamily protein
MPTDDLRHYVRVYDEALEAGFCAKLIDSFNNLQRFQLVNGRTLRRGLEESAWTELNITRLADAGFTGFFRMQIDHTLERYNRDIGLTIQVPNSPKFSELIMKRYRPDRGPGQEERFQLHFDAVNHLANRYLVMLWYLNDVSGGGATRFPQLGLEVAPRAGRQLVFPPYWMFQHEGLAPLSGDKYILSTYLLFTDSPGIAPHAE